MAVHEWHVETFKSPGFFQKDSMTDAGGLPNRLRELEEQGFEIYTLGFSFQSNNVSIVYRRQAGTL